MSDEARRDYEQQREYADDQYRIAERDAALGIETEVILDDLRAAEAERDRLREALEEIAGYYGGETIAGRIARVALAAPTKEDTDE